MSKKNSIMSLSFCFCHITRKREKFIVYLSIILFSYFSPSLLPFILSTISHFTLRGGRERYMIKIISLIPLSLLFSISLSSLFYHIYRISYLSLSLSSLLSFLPTLICLSLPSSNVNTYYNLDF